MNDVVKQTIVEALNARHRQTIQVQALNDAINGIGFTANELARLDAALVAINEPVWMPVKGPVIIEVGPGVIVVFRADSAEVLGATKAYPKGYQLCECRSQEIGL